MLDTVYLTGICLKRRPPILCGNWTSNNKTVQISVWLPEYACLIPFPVVHVLFLSWKNNVLLCHKYSLKGGYHDLLNGHFVPWLCMTKKKQIRLTDPWAIAPTTTTIGSSFGMISFHFTSLSEWKEVPRNQGNIWDKVMLQNVVLFNCIDVLHVHLHEGHVAFSQNSPIFRQPVGKWSVTGFLITWQEIKKY